MRDIFLKIFLDLSQGSKEDKRNPVTTTTARESIMGKETAQHHEPGQGWLELLQLAAAGNEGAATQLLTEIRPFLREHVERLRGTQNLGPVDTSDVIQECLLKIWKNAAQVHGTTEREVQAWLKAIARHGFLDHVQRGGPNAPAQVPLPADSSGGAVAAETPSPSQQAAHREEQQRREEARSRLSPEDQQVLRLRFDERRDWPEIAKELGVNMDAAKQRYYRAVRRWKDQLEAQS
jgi:RNA polymerase sigma factor (sigma-70 family)